jgi:allantoinase
MEDTYKRIAIRSERVITPDGVRKAVVMIGDGKILDITASLPTGEFHTIDAKENVVMAGIIDPHVHINEPGRTDWEGFDSATRAALAGGITSLVEMPLNAKPVTTTAAAWDKKINAARDQLHANCGFWGGIVPGNTDEIGGLIQRGALGFKAILTHSGIDDFPNVKEEDLRKAMPIIASYGLPLLVHCELVNSNTQLVDPNLLSKNERRSYQAYLNSRPGSWEVDAIKMMIRLCEEYECRTHIVHLSSAAALPYINDAKQKGLPLTVETAQHYLYFDSDSIADGNTSYKCAPPIRNKKNQLQLWDALENGLIDFVATDHSPAPPQLKEIESGDLFRAWGGIASLQFALPALWTAARQIGYDINDVARWLCENPSRLPGLQRFKGKLEKGYDADIVIWNPEASFTVRSEKILHRHPQTPYLHELLYGKVEQTWLNGELVYDDEKFLHLGKGRIL